MCTRLFLVFSLSRCSFATVSAGMECNIKSPVMVSHWTYSGYIYAVRNCKSHSVAKLVVLSCQSVASRYCACCVPAFLVQLCNVSAGMEYNE